MAGDSKVHLGSGEPDCRGQGSGDFNTQLVTKAKKRFQEVLGPCVSVQGREKQSQERQFQRNVKVPLLLNGLPEEKTSHHRHPPPPPKGYNSSCSKRLGSFCARHCE